MVRVLIVTVQRNVITNQFPDVKKKHWKKNVQRIKKNMYLHPTPYFFVPSTNFDNGLSPQVFQFYPQKWKKIEKYGKPCKVSLLSFLPDW